MRNNLIQITSSICVLLLFSHCTKQKVSETSNTNKEAAVLKMDLTVGATSARVTGENLNDFIITRSIDEELIPVLAGSFGERKAELAEIDQNILLENINFSGATISNEKESIAQAIVLPLNATGETKAQFAYFIPKLNNQLGRPYLLKVVDRTTIQYYDLENGFVVTLLIGQSEAVSSVAGFRQRPKCTGQAVMNCINDAYNNHGWVSVWAWIQSTFIPTSAAAIASACAIANGCA